MLDSTALQRVHATDTTTARRTVAHGHFVTGEDVWVVGGSADGKLMGARMTIVVPSWHTPTDEDGWRLRDPKGGARTFLTAHPRYLIHAARSCEACFAYAEALAEEVLPQLPATGAVHGGWYYISPLGQIVHRADTP